MKTQALLFIIICSISCISEQVFAQKTIYVRPAEIDDVLTNPGIGFTTFQRFNGDDLNKGIGWTEGKPIEYQDFDGNLENPDHPMTSIAYFRIYWKFIEPEMHQYNWEIIDKALQTAQNRGQSLLLRIAPYGNGKEKDVPAWYRKMVGDKEEWLPEGKKGWRVDAEDPRYAQYFGGFISELGKRYDGHPGLEAMDLSIVGFWGEGRGSSILTRKTRAALVNAYTDNFRETPLIMLLTDEKTNKYGLSQADVGWRVDCIGDLRFWAEEQDGWSHMYRYYPWGISNFGMKDAWEKAPVSLEICYTLKKWKEDGFTVKDVDYIIDETLKWHISSFNAKSSGVPPEWQPQIDRWLNRMGYRFVLRNFAFPEFVRPNEKLSFKSWWENKGVAPCYKKFILAIRLKNKKNTKIMLTDADIRTWLPGDNIYDSSIFIPFDMPIGNYELQVGIVDRQSHEPKIKLAIEGGDAEGWYSIGKITVNK